MLTWLGWVTQLPKTSRVEPLVCVVDNNYTRTFLIACGHSYRRPKQRWLPCLHLLHLHVEPQPPPQTHTRSESVMTVMTSQCDQKDLKHLEQFIKCYTAGSHQGEARCLYFTFGGLTCRLSVTTRRRWKFRCVCVCVEADAVTLVPLQLHFFLWPCFLFPAALFKLKYKLFSFCRCLLVH